MAKRDNGGKRTTTNTAATATEASAAPMATDAMERRVVAFAEQLGRIVGTVQAKAEGWMDRDALHKQIANVRDSAADLLGHLADSVTKASKKAPVNAASKSKSKGRSGGVVDAQASKMRTARTMMKTTRLRGRG